MKNLKNSQGLFHRVTKFSKAIVEGILRFLAPVTTSYPQSEYVSEAQRIRRNSEQARHLYYMIR